MALGSPRPRKESPASNRMAAPDGERGGDDEGWQRVGQDHPPDEAPVGGADRTGRPDIVELLDPEEFGPGEAGDRRPAYQPDRDGDGDEVRAEEAHQRHREQQGGQHLEELGDPHQPLVQEPAVETGRRADGDADDHADGGGACAHCEGGPAAVDDPGEYVAPQEIAAERDRRRFARRCQRPPYDVEGVDGVERGQALSR